ncbi:MAG: hypothetical protein JW705_00030 [Methanosarcinaceae archaeon]|nr:hypothetical protein [Methanosarcinaceae archaeon]
MKRAVKIYDYLQEQGERVMIGVIGKPPSEYGAMLEMFGAALKHGQFIAGSVQGLQTLPMRKRIMPLRYSCSGS